MGKVYKRKKMLDKCQRPTSSLPQAGVYARPNFCADFQVRSPLGLL